MSDGAYYMSKEYLVKKYAGLSQEERDEKREGFDRLRRFHSKVDNTTTVSFYKRLLAILDEAEKEIQK